MNIRNRLHVFMERHCYMRLHRNVIDRSFQTDILSKLTVYLINSALNILEARKEQSIRNHKISRNTCITEITGMLAEIYLEIDIPYRLRILPDIGINGKVLFNRRQGQIDVFKDFRKVILHLIPGTLIRHIAKVNVFKTEVDLLAEVNGFNIEDSFKHIQLAGHIKRFFRLVKERIGTFVICDIFPQFPFKTQTVEDCIQTDLFRRTKRKTESLLEHCHVKVHPVLRNFIPFIDT